MSFPRYIRNELHRAKESEEAKIPYDPAVASKVIIKGTPSDTEQLVEAVWDRNPWDMFDRKTVLAYTGNLDRINGLLREFERVGLTGVHIHWNFDNSFDRQLYEWCKSEYFTPALFNNAIGHYSIIKTAHSLGCRTCLVLEDDIRFLRDVELMRDIICAVPADFDIAMLDSVGSHVKQGKQVNEHWRTFDNLTSAACYALSKRGMEYMIAVYESSLIQFAKSGSSHGVYMPLRPSDMYFRREIADRFDSTLKMYHAVPNVARQTAIAGSKTNTNYIGWSQTYDRIGCQRGKYGK